jgi:hypothetical protein
MFNPMVGVVPPESEMGELEATEVTGAVPLDALVMPPFAL